MMKRSFIALSIHRINNCSENIEENATSASENILEGEQNDA